MAATLVAMATREVDIQNHSAQYYQLRYSGYGARYHAAVVNWLLAKATGCILDAGCGTGFVSQLRPDLAITGVDISPAMKRWHPGACQIADVEALPYDEGEFDFVLGRSILHHLPNHRQGLAELYRVLKPGGRAAFWETNKSWLAQQVRQRTQHGDRFSAYHHSFKDTELLHDICQAGFITDQVTYMGYVAYPLFGFPDIINVARWVPLKPLVFPMTLWIDDILSRLPFIRRWAFAIGIQAHKP